MIRKIFNAQFNSLCTLYILLSHAFRKKNRFDLADSGATRANRQTDIEIILGI